MDGLSLKILNEIATYCGEECCSSGCCPEEICVLFRIEKIITGGKNEKGNCNY